MTSGKNSKIASLNLICVFDARLVKTGEYRLAAGYIQYAYALKINKDKEIVYIEYQMAFEKSRLLQLSTKSSQKLLSFKFCKPFKPLFGQR